LAEAIIECHPTAPARTGAVFRALPRILDRAIAAGAPVAESVLAELEPALAAAHAGRDEAQRAHLFHDDLDAIIFHIDAVRSALPQAIDAMRTFRGALVGEEKAARSRRGRKPKSARDRVTYPLLRAFRDAEIEKMLPDAAEGDGVARVSGRRLRLTGTRVEPPGPL
jgi:hypothetical protein